MEKIFPSASKPYRNLEIQHQEDIVIRFVKCTTPKSKVVNAESLTDILAIPIQGAYAEVEKLYSCGNKIGVQCSTNANDIEEAISVLSAKYPSEAEDANTSTESNDGWLNWSLTERL